MSDPSLPAAYKGSMGEGIRTAAKWNIGAFVVGLVTIPLMVGVFIIAGFGLVQLFWLIPFWQGAKGRGESESAKGILLGMGITFLLSAGCWGALTVGLRIR